MKDIYHFTLHAKKQMGLRKISINISKMQFYFDEQTGVYNIQFSTATIEDSELKQNLVIDYDKNGKIVGLEVFPFNIEKKPRDH